MQTSVDFSKENQAQSCLIITPHLRIYHAQHLEMKVYEKLNNTFCARFLVMQWLILEAKQNVNGCVNQFPSFWFFSKLTPENWWGKILLFPTALLLIAFNVALLIAFCFHHLIWPLFFLTETCRVRTEPMPFFQGIRMVMGHGPYAKLVMGFLFTSLAFMVSPNDTLIPCWAMVTTSRLGCLSCDRHGRALLPLAIAVFVRFC